MKKANQARTVKKLRVNAEKVRHLTQDMLTAAAGGSCEHPSMTTSHNCSKPPLD